MVWVKVFDLSLSLLECKDHYDHYYMYRHHHNLPGNMYMCLTCTCMYCACDITCAEFPFRLVSPPTAQHSVSEEKTSPVYYPGTEIHGYMPHRADFAHVSILYM